MARMTPNHDADCCCEKCVCEKAESEQQLETIVAAAAKKLNEAKPSPPVGLLTKPTLAQQIAWIRELVEFGGFTVYQPVVDSLKRLQRIDAGRRAAHQRKKGL